MARKYKLKRRKLYGKGFFGDVWNGLKKAGKSAYNIGGKVADWAKENKPSKLISTVPNPYFQAAGSVLDLLGMGKGKKRFTKGSKQAKLYMAKLRSMRKK